MIDELESHGYRIDFMNGLGRPGHCDPPRYKHQCGWAIDINQTARGVVTLVATNYGLFAPTGSGFRVVELAPGMSFEEVRAATGAPLEE